MATDLKVQFFSHINNIALGNNWGDLIRMLDTCLVNGLPFSSITAASIDANGDINLTFFAAHNAVLFQIVELTSFSPSNVNAKYRIKGLPSSTQMILKAELSGQSITANGSAKLAALGYDIVFRDANDVKRVYRAKNPSSAHPFIRVDESISDGTNSYTSTYAKYAMVGLIENMTHIDDYEDPAKLQLPLDTTNLKKNWQITGTGTSVVRGWSRWYWAMQSGGWNTSADSTSPQTGSRSFTLLGDSDAFYLLNQSDSSNNSKHLNGCGLFNTALKTDLIPNWFLMSYERLGSASTVINKPGAKTGSPLMKNNGSISTATFMLPRFTELNRISDRTYALPLLPSNYSGVDNLYPSSNLPALEIPFSDEQSYLRGSLKHVYYSGKTTSPTVTTPIASDKSMYICDAAGYVNLSNGMFYFYLGEIE